MEEVILVDTKDNEVGAMEKLKAHQKGILHRAFSVLLFNRFGQLLLQKRSQNKYHSAGLWSNTCCSHPRPGEALSSAVKRRLHEEMGIDLEPMFLYKFIYKADLPEGLTEHEFDYVFIGRYDEDPEVNAKEVEDWKFMSWDDINRDMAVNEAKYSSWFKIISGNIQEHLKQISYTSKEKIS